jgi:ankyrin repeat protein
LMSLACTAACKACVQLLLHHGCNATNAVPMCLDAIPAAGAPAIECLEVLLRNGADVTEDGEIEEDTFLSYAVKLPMNDIHYSEVIRMLLAHGADSAVNYPDNDGRTPLMLARSPAVAKQLMDANTYLPSIDIVGKTALDYAIASGRWTVAKAIKNRLGGAAAYSNTSSRNTCRKTSVLKRY